MEEYSKELVSSDFKISRMKQFQDSSVLETVTDLTVGLTLLDMLIMDNTEELNALRDLRETNLAIKELEQQQAIVSKNFKRGIRLLQREAAITESQIDDGGVMEGCESWNVRHESIKQLISNPCIDNIPEDNSV